MLERVVAMCLSRRPADSQLTAAPVLEMFWQKCFLETNLGTGYVEQVIIKMKIQVLAAKS